MIVALWLTLGSVAWADCPDPEPQLRAAADDAVSLFLADAQRSLDAAAASFACSRVSPEVLGRYWLTQAMIRALKDDPGADRALTAARRDAPELFIDAFGDELRARWLAAPPAGGAQVAFDVRGSESDDQLVIDTVPADAPVAPEGLHLVQLVRGGLVVMGRVVTLRSGERLEIAAPRALPAEPTTGPATESPDPPEPPPPTGAPAWLAAERPLALPLARDGRQIRDADRSRLSLHRDVLPVALVTQQGRRAFTIRRRNAYTQAAALGLCAAGAWGLHVTSWERRRGDNLGYSELRVATGASLLALVSGVAWEASLVARRGRTRAQLVDAVNTLALPPVQPSSAEP